MHHSDQGVQYVLEFTETLTTTAWKPLDSVLGDGTVKTLSDPGATNYQRYYRVRVE